MEIRELRPDDIHACVNLLIETYNPPPWNNQWTAETAGRYLADFLAQPSFIGFVAVEASELVAAMFAHRKTWWTNDELFVDELFVKPEWQRQGYGKALLGRAEALSQASGWGGVTLLTNKYQPSKQFYEKNGYLVAEHVIFMYKVT